MLICSCLESMKVVCFLYINVSKVDDSNNNDDDGIKRLIYVPQEDLFFLLFYYSYKNWNDMFMYIKDGKFE